MTDFTNKYYDKLATDINQLSDLLEKQPEQRPTDDRSDPNPQNTVPTNIAPDHYLCTKSPEDLLQIAIAHRTKGTEHFKQNQIQQAANQYELAIKKLIVAKMHDDYVWKKASSKIDTDDLTKSDYEQNRITSLPKLLSALDENQAKTLLEIYVQLATVHNNGS